MNFKQLEAFLWVAELQSFTKAARQLYISQPAISFQIKALEEDLQAPLFQRGDKKVMLTEAGRILYPEAKKMLRHYQKIKEGLEDLKGLKTGHLMVGASTIPGEYILPLLVGGFKNKYPGIEITLKVAGSTQVARWVRQREIDLGFTGVPVNNEGIHCVPWLKDQLVLIVPPSHKWANLAHGLDVAELKNETMILREQGSGTRRSLEKKLEEKNIEMNKIPCVMELGSTRAVITAVEAGLGVSIVSRYAVQDALELGKVVEVPLVGLDLARYLYLLRHPQEPGGFAVEAFGEFVSDKDNCKRFLRQ